MSVQAVIWADLIFDDGLFSLPEDIGEMKQWVLTREQVGKVKTLEEDSNFHHIYR